jgi:hypothetical protein
MFLADGRDPGDAPVLSSRSEANPVSISYSAVDGRAREREQDGSDLHGEGLSQLIER